MGGIVRLSIRESSGKITNMLHHTNTLKSVLLDSDILQEGPDLIALLDNWKLGKSSFLKDPDSYSSKWYEKTIYGNNESLSPFDYGIVFIDFKERNIFSLQGYTSLNKLHENLILGQVSSWIQILGEQETEKLFMENKRSDVSFVSALLHRKLVDKITVHQFANRRYLGNISPIPETLVSLYHKALPLLDDVREETISLDINLSGFTLYDIDESQEGVNDLITEFSRTGIPLTNNEKSAFLSFYYED